jgi:hypothetical protein
MKAAVVVGEYGGGVARIVSESSGYCFVHE